MRTRTVIVVLAPVLAAVIVLVLAATRPAVVVLQTQALPEGPTFDLSEGTLCQLVAVPAGSSFTRVVLLATETAGSATPLRLTVQTEDSRRTLAKGSTEAGWPQAPKPVTIDLDRRIADKQDVIVCLPARGKRHPAMVYGSTNLRFVDAPTSINGQNTGKRMFLMFQRPGAKRLGQLPAMVQRMRLFRARWLETWMVWPLVGLVLVGIPGLLAFALLGTRSRADS